MPSTTIIPAFTAEFLRYRNLAEGAAAQITWPDLRTPLDKETNSIAIIMKHIAGNLRSRWTDPLTTDGEKPWRNRDQEFIDDFPSRESLMTTWTTGWSALDTSLASFTDADLPRTLTIRGEPHTLILALTRSLSHTSYHCGQIVTTSRVMCKDRWQTITIPRGQSRQFNASKGFTPHPDDR